MPSDSPSRFDVPVADPGCRDGEDDLPAIAQLARCPPAGRTTGELTARGRALRRVEDPRR